MTCCCWWFITLSQDLNLAMPLHCMKIIVLVCVGQVGHWLITKRYNCGLSPHFNTGCGLTTVERTRHNWTIRNLKFNTVLKWAFKWQLSRISNVLLILTNFHNQLKGYIVESLLFGVRLNGLYVNWTALPRSYVLNCEIITQVYSEL